MPDARVGPGARRWREWLGVALIVALLMAFRSAVADWNHVPSGSMQPSILTGDRIAIDKLAYGLRIPFTMLRVARWADPARGDIVTFRSPEDGRLLVKRVVAVPGDAVELNGSRLAINGVAASYQALTDPSATHRAQDGTQPRSALRTYRETLLGSSRTVILTDDASAEAGGSLSIGRIPPGRFLLLGDNRVASRDSRQIGLVERDSIVGRATRILFSLDRDDACLPRRDRFLAPLH